MEQTYGPADWALFYARVGGWRSFPVQIGKKVPAYRNWQADATTDEKLIRQYWGDPERNVGLVCGEKFDAWDIEADHIAALSSWMYKNDYLLPPDCPIASTGRGGVHILTAPTGVDGSRNLYLEGTHIGELKSRGGFIVACPSEVVYDDHAGDYLWVNAPQPGWMPPAQTWMLDLIRKSTPLPKGVPWKQVSLAPESDLKPLVRAVENTPAGDRNGNLHWAANRACDDGVPFEMAERDLLAAYLTISIEGESRFEREHEGRATIASAYNR